MRKSAFFCAVGALILQSDIGVADDVEDLVRIEEWARKTGYAAIVPHDVAKILDL